MKLINSQSIIASSLNMERIVEIYDENKGRLSLKQMYEQEFCKLEPRLKGKAGYMAVYRFFRKYNHRQRLQVRKVLELADNRAIGEEAVRQAIYKKALELGDIKLTEALEKPENININQAMRWLFKSLEAKDRGKLLTLKIEEFKNQSDSAKDALVMLAYAARAGKLDPRDIGLSEAVDADFEEVQNDNAPSEN